MRSVISSYRLYASLRDYFTQTEVTEYDVSCFSSCYSQTHWSLKHSINGFKYDQEKTQLKMDVVTLRLRQGKELLREESPAWQHHIVWWAWVRSTPEMIAELDCLEPSPVEGSAIECIFYISRPLTRWTSPFEKLRTFVTQNEIEAAFIMSGTGDLTRANIQFPNKMVGMWGLKDTVNFFHVTVSNRQKMFLWASIT